MERQHARHDDRCARLCPIARADAVVVVVEFSTRDDEIKYTRLHSVAIVVVKNVSKRMSLLTWGFKPLLVNKWPPG